MTPMSTEFLQFCWLLVLAVYVLIGIGVAIEERLRRPERPSLLSWAGFFVKVSFCTSAAVAAVMYLAALVS